MVFGDGTVSGGLHSDPSLHVPVHGQGTPEVRITSGRLLSIR
jgi:hypothetical protein